MKFTALIFFLIGIIGSAQGLSHSLTNTPEDALSVNDRIIQGWPAVAGQFPHQVHLRLVTPTGSLNACGGSLITSQWVLTAAHCLVAKTQVFVRLGTLDVTFPGMLLEATDFFIHPKYNPTSLNNDLGLINLGRDVPISATIKPIRLPGLDAINTTFAGEIATVSGWGRTGNTLPVSETLNYVNVTIITNAICMYDYSSIYIVDSTICSVGIQNTAQGTCNGDSGGPLIHYGSDGEPTLIGVVSFVSSRGCDSGYAAGYERPQFFLDWINESIAHAKHL